MKRFLAAAALAAATASASAVPFIQLSTDGGPLFTPVVGGGTYTLPGAPANPVNNVLATLANPTGSFTAYQNVDLFVSEGANVIFTLLGRESAFNNQFISGGSVRFQGNDVSPGFGSLTSNFGTHGYITLTGGLLDFAFWVNGDSMKAVTNGSNGPAVPATGTITVQNFVYIPLSANEGLIMLDDDGNGPSDNHDDLVIRVAVPAPGVLALLGLGVLGLGASLRRRRAA